MRKLLALILGLLLWANVAIAAAPTLDGSVTAGDGHTTNTSASVSLTTTSVNDIIVFVIQTFNPTSGSSSAPTVSSVTGGSLTWAKRASKNQAAVTGFGAINTEIWWAFSSGTLSAVSLTSNFSSGTPYGVIAFGVNGAGSTTAPWDTNASLTGINSGQYVTGSPRTITYSTDYTTDFAIGIYSGAAYAGAQQGPPTGFTSIGFAGAGNFSGNNQVNVWYNRLASAQSGTTVAPGITQANNTTETLMIDGIYAGAIAHPKGGGLLLRGVGN